MVKRDAQEAGHSMRRSEKVTCEFVKLAGRKSESDLDKWHDQSLKKKRIDPFISASVLPLQSPRSNSPSGLFMRQRIGCAFCVTRDS